MSDTLQEVEDQMSEHQVNRSGVCQIPGCPCRGWSAQETASKTQFWVSHHGSDWHLKGAPCAQCDGEHQPAARGGGEWQASKPLTNQILRNDIGGSYLIAGIDVLTSDHDHFGKIAVFGDDCNEVVVQIITEHNQHHSLVAERERLLELLRQVTSATKCYCATLESGKCWQCQAREAIKQRSTSE